MVGRSPGCVNAHAATSRSPIEKTKFGRSSESWQGWCSAPAPSLAWRNSSRDSTSCRVSPSSSPRSRTEPLGLFARNSLKELGGTHPLHVETGALAVEKVDVRLVHDADLLHGLAQVGGLSKRPRAAEISCLEQQDDFIRILGSPEKVLLREPCFGAFGEVSVVSTLPLREVRDLVPEKHIGGHSTLRLPLGSNETLPSKC